MFKSKFDCPVRMKQVRHVPKANIGQDVTSEFFEKSFADKGEPDMTKNSQKTWSIQYDKYNLHAYNQIKVNGAIWKKYQDGNKPEDDSEPPEFHPLEVRVYDADDAGIKALWGDIDLEAMKKGEKPDFDALDVYIDW